MFKKSSLLKLENITMKFPGVIALDNVSLEIEEGEIHGIIGENGAGKSTLCNIITGVYTNYLGDIFFNGNKVKFTHPKDALNLGISMVYQERNLVSDLTGMQNISLGIETTGHFGFIKRNEDNKKIKEVQKECNLNVELNVPVQYLSASKRQMIEILRAIYRKPKLLILDEPTASLSREDVNGLFVLIKKLKSQGISVIFISHKLEEVLENCDRISILRNGKKISSYMTSKIDYATCVKEMVNRDLTSRYPQVNPTQSNQTILEVKDLSDEDGFIKNINFYLKEGEVVGLYGLVGAGRTEFLETIFGIRRKGSGFFNYYGKKIFKENTTKEIMNLGIYLVPENRAEDGLFGNFNIKQNISIGCLYRLTKRFMKFIDFKKEALYAKKVADSKELTIKYKDINQFVEELSGGNKQKIIIGRWISQENIKLLMLDEPTQGIDVGTKYELYVFIRKIAENKKCGIIFSSSEISEIVGISDRIYVFRNGEISKEFSQRQDFNMDQILTYAL